MNRLQRWMARAGGFLPANLAVRLDRGPLCSFTFDDCCRSAMLVAGRVLESVGAGGTFFVSGSMLSRNGSGDMLRPDELKTLVAGGHEIGSHSFSHRSVIGQSQCELHDDVVLNAQTLIGPAGIEGLFTFSYPFGEVSYAAKRFYGKRFAAARGIRAGLNRRLIDVSELRAFKIYHRTYTQARLERVIRQCRRKAAWLIFYTHDVAETPSSWGCTPAEFESVVHAVVAEQIPILTMKAAVGRVMFRGTGRTDVPDTASSGRGRNETGP